MAKRLFQSTLPAQSWRNYPYRPRPEKTNQLININRSIKSSELTTKAGGIADAIYILDLFNEIITYDATCKYLEYSTVDNGTGIFAEGVLEATYFNAVKNLTAADPSNATRAKVI